MESKKKSTTASTQRDDSSGQIYKSLIDNSTSAIFLTKPGGQIIEVNTAAEKMFGYKKEEFLKLGRQGILDHTDENLQVVLTQRKETGKAKGEVIGIGKSGTKFPIEYTSTVFIDHFGEEFTCTIMQDITGRKIVEQEMLLMLNNTEECFLLLDKKLLILNYNKQFKDLYKSYFHLSIEKGISIVNFVKPERLADARKTYKAVLKGEVIFKILDTKDEEGEDHYFKIKYAPSKNEANEIIGIFITIRDITNETKSNIEIEKRQLKLEQAEANYREIFEKANDAIFIHELETGRLLNLNKKGCELFGNTKSKILAADPSIFSFSTPGYTFDEAKDKFKKAAEGTPQLFEWISRHSDGTLNWVEVSLQKATIAGTE
ncbi:MAG: PAS domain S-box protein, partial [Ferruginibacter sp.]|nr:PAS domain S-box protein [Ferruginibacter sp.]